MKRFDFALYNKNKKPILVQDNSNAPIPVGMEETSNGKFIRAEDLRELLEEKIQFYDKKIGKGIYHKNSYLRFCERRNECFRLLAELEAKGDEKNE